MKSLLLALISVGILGKADDVSAPSPDYNAHMDERLNSATGKAWANGFAKCLKGELDPNELAHAVAEAELSGGKKMTEPEFAALLPASPKLAWKGPSSITRGDALQLMFSLRP